MERYYELYAENEDVVLGLFDMVDNEEDIWVDIYDDRDERTLERRIIDFFEEYLPGGEEYIETIELPNREAFFEELSLMYVESHPEDGHALVSFRDENNKLICRKARPLPKNEFARLFGGYFSAIGAKYFKSITSTKYKKLKDRWMEMV